ncbi:MAG: hypothetical protein SLAVMIC_00069 [uncultured marine phage]|uniref:Uncharacterized protein n=1 Tax=uncultured marine phage TaxID=707152 RepID=A0A8D9CAZ4_9VIRU|nr:MAG: hypothetical protein SLAVMIC_00069 [uncultured marine phage]
MNENIIKFTQLCAKSRYQGLTAKKHIEKNDLLDKLIEDGLMYNDNGNNKFVNKEDSDYFIETIKNWDK